MSSRGNFRCARPRRSRPPDPVVEDPIQQLAGSPSREDRFCGVDGGGHWPAPSRLRLTSSLRSLPDEVLGSDPGRVMNTTSAGTTSHSEAISLRQRRAGGGFVGALELRGDHQPGT